MMAAFQQTAGLFKNSPATLAVSLQLAFMALDHPHVKNHTLLLFPGPNTPPKLLEGWRESFSEINNRTITHSNLPDLLSSKDVSIVAKALLRNARTSSICGAVVLSNFRLSVEDNENEIRAGLKQLRPSRNTEPQRWPVPLRRRSGPLQVPERVPFEPGSFTGFL